MSKYMCELCKNTFDMDENCSDEDALNEFKKNYPHLEAKDMATVCEDCYQKVRDWLEKLSPEERKAMEEV